MEFSSTRVSCYSGYRADETPRSFETGDGLITVTEVRDMWVERSRNEDTVKRFFRVLGDNGAHYLLRHEEPDGGWSYQRLPNKINP